MSSGEISGTRPRWTSWVEKFEEIVVAVLALLLVIVVAVILVVVTYLFAIRVGTMATTVENVVDLQNAALRAFSGILLVLLGLELLDTVKVYFREHSVRVEVILLVGLIAMGRHVLEIDFQHTEMLVLFGFSSLLLALAVSYFLVKRAQVPPLSLRGRGRKESGDIPEDK